MKDNKMLKINRVIAICSILCIIGSIIYGINMWYMEDGTYKKMESDAITEMSKSQKIKFISENFNILSDTFSIDKLWEVLSDNTKNKFKDKDALTKYINENVKNKVTGNNFVIDTVLESEKKEKSFTNMKYKLYIYDINEYSATNPNDVSMAKASIDIHLIEYAPREYQIEI